MKKIALFAFIFLIIGVIGTLTFARDVFSIGPKETIDTEEQLDGNNITDVEIEMDVGKVVLRESDNDKVMISLNGDVSKKRAESIELDVSEEDGTVVASLKNREKFGFSIQNLFDFGDKGSVVLVVSVPNKEYQSVNVSTNVGMIVVEKIHAQKFMAVSDVGKIVVDELTSEQASLTSDVGEIIVQDGVGAFDVETDTGRIQLNMLEVTENIYASSNVGQVNITVKQQPENLVLDLESDIGEVVLKNVNGFSNYSGKQLSAETGTKGPVITASTDVGKILVEHQR
ncbi:DUF4097 family beta strand repeat-containing protein [Aquibacillus saliphilus]|uniref:DUF4097 family beta strand repeat-containing protein n=1 Tax=Aquibacillus saliphilus TaxID=1909422 RepID=UPI001CF04DDF|nr:DUF4097 family beta strand repeat-containing protein [Aquibacillus saliphilus]